MQGFRRSDSGDVGGDVAAVRTTREAFLAAPATSTQLDAVRSDIATSWQRSQQMGVEPDSVEVPYDDDAPTPHRLLDAALPVIDRLASQLTDTSATFLLANSEARIVQRWACRSFLPTLDRFNVAPGFSFSEYGVGTNGLGCAAEEKRIFEVRGPEHFRECLQSLVCVAAPIVLPTTNTVHGVLNVTCTVEEANAYLRPLLLGAVADIERRMFETASVRERLVLDAYLSRSRRSVNGVVAMSADIVMANPAAEAMLSSSDRLVLWQWAREALTSHREATRTFDGGAVGEISVTASVIGDARPPIGVLIELREAPVDRVRTLARADDPLADVIVGRSAAAGQLRRAVGVAATDRSHVVVVGPDGSGRSFVARAVATGGRADVPVAQVGRLVESGDQLGDEAMVLVRNIDRWGAGDVEELLAAADATATRVVATAGEARLGDAVVRCFGHRVEVPALARRTDDIPDLCRQLLAELCGAERVPAVRRDALEALLRHDWPGNIAELRAVLSVGLAAADRADISVFHLPESVRAGDPLARWSTIELAEREAIMRALSDHEGNKVAAAAALGVARSTLYRKLRAFHIDVA